MPKFKEAQKLLSDLGDAINIPSLAFDENKLCVLSFEEAAIISLQYNDETDVLLIHSCVGTLPETNQEPILMDLLSANCYWQGTQGATIGVEKEGGLIILAYPLQMPMPHPNQFQDIISNFVELARDWTLKVRELKGES